MSSQSTILILNKPVGRTPLEMIDQCKIQYPHYKNTPLGYAGRLDPMAEGVLLVLVGDRNKERKHLEKLQKTYVFEVLFGVATDTYDILGKVTNTRLPGLIEKSVIEASLPSFVGKQTQPYPPYSSPRVKGHPLFWWARAGRLQEIVTPEKEIEIYRLQLLKVQTVTLSSIEQSIQKRINLVSGQFRQQEILAQWKEFFEKQGDEQVVIASFSATCSSGTYIRSLAQAMGEKIGYPALAFSIRRTAVGPFTLEDALPLEL